MNAIRDMQVELMNIKTTGKSMISYLRLQDMGLVTVKRIISKTGHEIGLKMILTSKANAMIDMAI